MSTGTEDPVQWAFRDEMATVEPEDFASIRVRLDEITNCPWYRSPDNQVISWSARPDGPTMIIGRGADLMGAPIIVLPDTIDAQFIADAPSIVEGLLDAAEHWHARFQDARERALTAETELEKACVPSVPGLSVCVAQLADANQHARQCELRVNDFEGQMAACRAREAAIRLRADIAETKLAAAQLLIANADPGDADLIAILASTLATSAVLGDETGTDKAEVYLGWYSEVVPLGSVGAQDQGSTE